MRASTSSPELTASCSRAAGTAGSSSSPSIAETMPTISRKNVAAGTANAVDGLQFQDIPAGGALVTIYASTAAAGGTIDYTVDQERMLVAAELNIEGSADVVNTEVDLILNREPVPAGKQFMSVNSQVANFVLVIENLPQ